MDTRVVSGPVPERVRQRRRAFTKALRYADSLKAYPRGEIAGDRYLPFHACDVVELIETRPYRGLSELKPTEAITKHPKQRGSDTSAKAMFSLHAS